MEPAGIALIAGLGNPGNQYAATRHNVGFWLLERLQREYPITFATEKKFKAQIGRFECNGRRVRIILSVAKLEVIEYKYVENYLIFVLLLTASIMLQFSKDYHKISKKYPYLRDMKQSLEIESKKYRAGINERHIILGLEKLDRSQNLPVDVLKFIEKTLEKYKEKETTG